MPRRKALLIGINYHNSSHELKGCINDAYNMREFLVRDRGFPSDPRSMILLTDSPENRGTAYEPISANMMHAFQWLVTNNNPGDSVFLSYSGHGGQVRDPDGDRDSGFDDTICPLDFERHGQITSDTLHKVIVSPMDPRVRLTIVFDCCHSGSAVELPYVYRPDSNGQVNLVDNVKQGISLASAAFNLVQGGFSMNKVDDAKMLLGGAKSFFHGLHHRPEETNEDGLAEENFVEDWKNEHKDVWMFSGCADDQTSADANIAGSATGAMSWALLKTMRANPQQSYINVLQNTREALEQRYKQIPQLSVGAQYNLDQVVSCLWRPFCCKSPQAMMATLRRSARQGLKKETETLAPIGPQSNGIKKASASKPPKTKSTNTSITNGTGTFAVPAIPSTPKRKRTTNTAATAPPPFTPTPSAVGLISAPYSTDDIDDATPPPIDRPVEPHVTNALLRTPGGSRVVAYQNGDVDSSPSKTGLPRPSTTTGTVLEEACAHLIKVDPKLRPLIEKHHCRIFSPEGFAEEIDPFRSLASGIISQQVSGAAAKSIKNKFVGLFHEGEAEDAVRFPTPDQVAKCSLERLRTAGLSGRKAEYIQGLAEKFATGELNTRMLIQASSDECLEKLIAVRGLGRWSVEMFLVFALKRLDILSTGDLGVQRGMAAYAGKDVAKLKAKGGGKWKYMSEQDMLDLSAKFAPYRSIFMWYMWRVEDVDVDAMQD